jgi:hypothetical protein
MVTGHHALSLSLVQRAVARIFCFANVCVVNCQLSARISLPRVPCGSEKRNNNSSCWQILKFYCQGAAAAAEKYLTGLCAQIFRLEL